ncbi:MAG: aspartate aminotransferase family protein [Acidobacteria bacterium]|nr:aspartate aminotransferase family protein [Acidobacteriota bacterium]
MDSKDFRHWAHRASEWAADYYESLPDHPVRAQVAPGEIGALIDAEPPESPQEMETIFADFERIVPQGMTHWQHPRFFAYFPSNAAPAAVVAEQLAGAMAAQCMLWQTSPAATELEVKMVEWLRQAVDLPESFKGVFQDTASSATLCAVLTMRERALGWQGNRNGLSGKPVVRVYASTRTHSSIDKAVWIAGIGQDNLVKIPTDEKLAMDVAVLRAAIRRDREDGLLPAGIVVCVGGTSTGATDDVAAVCQVAREEGLYSHVDAAWAGSAMICPEFRHLWAGVEHADSIVLNPHKWLGASMECSAHFVREPEMLVRTLSIQPEYLKTHVKGDQDGMVNFSEWSVQLGRRFRALKVWFLMRAYGLEGLRSRIRNHVAWARKLAERLAGESDFEIVTPPMLSLFSFRYVPKGPKGPEGLDLDLDALNLRLLNAINDDGRIYLTQTEHDGKLVIRFVAGQFETRAQDFDVAFDAICETARALIE